MPELSNEPIPSDAEINAKGRRLQWLRHEPVNGNITSLMDEYNNPETPTGNQAMIIVALNDAYGIEDVTGIVFYVGERSRISRVALNRELRERLAQLQRNPLSCYDPLYDRPDLP